MSQLSTELNSISRRAARPLSGASTCCWAMIASRRAYRARYETPWLEMQPRPVSAGMLIHVMDIPGLRARDAAALETVLYFIKKLARHTGTEM